MKEYFINTKTADKWEQIGTNRRGGIVVPLFSIYSKNSVGIGDLFDLKYVIDWCKQTGLSILQLLPLNEVGSDFAPYSAISSFALEPMYLSLDNLRDVEIKPFKQEINKLRNKYKPFNKKVKHRFQQIHRTKFFFPI